LHLALPKSERSEPVPTIKPVIPTQNEEEGPESLADLWAPAGDMATVGIFVMLLGICLYLCRPLLLPVMAAVVVGITLAPMVKMAARRGVPPWLTAGAIGLIALAAAGIGVTLLAKPVTSWVARAPEIGTILRERLYWLGRPIAALHELRDSLLPPSNTAVAVEPSQLNIVTPVLAYVTPAVAELVLFFVVLIFFLAVQMDFRRYMVSFFSTRDAKLRFIRIANDVEQNLASYLFVVTVINFCLGVVVGFGAWMFGFATPVLFGALAMALNYIPYVGAACMTAVLFAVGLVSFSSVTSALVPPLAFVGLATVEGQFITPTILGHRLTLNPLVVLLAIAFWSWIWGPMGTFLAVPLTIIGLVTLHHIFPPDESRLPM
jgi:predicted PurR-regulated permease PerM